MIRVEGLGWNQNVRATNSSLGLNSRVDLESLIGYGLASFSISKELVADLGKVGEFSGTS